jgi:ATP-dependent 26S proteasome regulatory subunit
MATTLCPTQQEEFDRLLYALSVGNVLVFYGNTGMGKTTVLQEVHRRHGGAFLTMKEYLDALRGQSPWALETTFERMVLDALNANDTVILDDLHLLTGVVAPCGMSFYPLNNLLLGPLNTLATYATATGKKLLFGSEGSAPGPIRQRAYHAGIEKFTAEDYAFLCHVYLTPDVADRLEYAKIHRFAPKLNAHQIKGACLWLRSERALDTEQFIDYLRSQKMASNVDLGEVQAVDLHELKGVDDVIQSLEASIILPLENDELANALDIKPKRGVLLAGPPGTGKTTVGRALAHRLKSKFFLIDGTFISGTRNFYERIHQVFEAAKQNAPSIIFIDDSDVIFENREEMGLYRYLLTMLDGLESESAGRVCVMMTAMDVGNLPPALVRSGRVELWLETRLPDEAARAAILRDRLVNLPSVMGKADVATLAAATEGLTGADIKRLIEDGKILFAYDKAQGRTLRSVTEYLLAAIETVRANKQRYAQAEAAARQRQSSRPSWFDVVNGMAMMHVDMMNGDGDED